MQVGWHWLADVLQLSYTHALTMLCIGIPHCQVMHELYAINPDAKRSQLQRQAVKEENITLLGVNVEKLQVDLSLPLHAVKARQSPHLLHPSTANNDHVEIEPVSNCL